MRIDIVTPSFNQCDYLEEMITSVLTQHGEFDLRLNILDAQSTDGTIELLQSVTDPRVTWKSEPDDGQSDAINKAIAACDGEIIGWLNSDDLYTPSALATVVAAFADPAVMWVVGRYQMINANGNVIRSSIARYKDRLLDRYSYRKLLRENFIAQPAVFWRRDFGLQAGPLDTSLHYTMDYDLWLRMARLARPLILNQTLARFRIHPTSKSGKVNREQFDEGYRVASRYFAGDTTSRIAHRFNVEKIVWAYRLMRRLGM